MEVSSLGHWVGEGSINRGRKWEETQIWVALREKGGIWLSFPCNEFEVSGKRE